MQKHFAATFYQRGQIGFEDGMNPFVKKNLISYFPPSKDYLRKMQKIAALDDGDEVRKQLLLDDLAAAQKAADVAKENFLANRTNSSLKQLHVAAQTKKKAVGKRVKEEIKRIDKAKKVRHQNKPTPRWIKAAHSAFPAHSKMIKFITVDSHFDMFTIAELMKHFLSDIFRVALGYGEYDSEAESLLERLQRATRLRTLRSHTYFEEEKQMPTEAEVLDGLAAMRRIFRLCKLDHGVKTMESIISDAQDLFEKSVHADADGVTPVCETVVITKDELRSHFLYTSLTQFEKELARQVGPVHIVSGHYVVKDDGSPPTFSAWTEARRDRFTSRKSDLKSIVLARNKFAHNNPLEEGNNTEFDLVKVLETMGKILHFFTGLKDSLPTTKWGDVPETWTNHLSYATLLGQVRDDKVEMQVKLVRSRSRMTIPIPPDECFTGREEDVRQVTKALMQNGARVLVHGPSGVGKSTLIAEVIRRGDISKYADISLVGWLSGSTDQVLQTDLIELFNLHHRELLRGLDTKSDARLKAIRNWLQTNDGWLIAVDDATSETETLARYILVNAPHGRVILSSKEQLDSPIGLTTSAIKTTLTKRLQPLSTTSCLKIWQAMRLFRVSQQDLDAMSSNKNIEAELESRCKRTKETPLLSAVSYVPPTPEETPGDMRQRHRKMESAVREYEGLSTPGLLDFFEESLGNLPVSVRLVGNMLLTSGGEGVGFCVNALTLCICVCARLEARVAGGG